jgi:hypothetical protein
VRALRLRQARGAERRSAGGTAPHAKPRHGPAWGAWRTRVPSPASANGRVEPTTPAWAGRAGVRPHHKAPSALVESPAHLPVFRLADARLRATRSGSRTARCSAKRQGRPTGPGRALARGSATIHPHNRVPPLIMAPVCLGDTTYADSSRGGPKAAVPLKRRRAVPADKCLGQYLHGAVASVAASAPDRCRG